MSYIKYENCKFQYYSCSCQPLTGLHLPRSPTDRFKIELSILETLEKYLKQDKGKPKCSMLVW